MKENSKLHTKGISLWFTGLPSSGKTTIARELSDSLTRLSLANVVLDGDQIRPIIAEGVDFSSQGRLKTTIKYIQLSKVLLDSKLIVILALNHHSQKQRQLAREAFPLNRYIEVWIDTPVELCKQRDVKGLYQKAARGEIEDLVGVSIAFEPPVNNDIRIFTPEESAPAAANKIIDYLKQVKVITPGK